MRPTPRRPAHSRSLRLSRRLAAGFSPAQAARAEGVPAVEVDALLAEPAFAELVAAFRDLEALPEDEQRRRLVGLARCTIELALSDGDARVAVFVLREEGRGRDPARTVADGVIAAGRRACAAAAEPAAAPPASAPSLPPARPRRRRPAHPADRLAWRVAARLRATVAREHAARFGAPAGEQTPSPRPSPAVAGEGASPAALARPRAPSPSRRERAGVRAPTLTPSPVRRVGEGRGGGGRNSPAPPNPIRRPTLNARLLAGTALGPGSSLGSPTPYDAAAFAGVRRPRPPPPPW